MVHRDIKIDNIVVNDKGEPFYIDFGGCDLIKNKQNTNYTYNFTIYTPKYCHEELLATQN